MPIPATQQIRELENGSRIPIIATTAYCLEGDKEKFLKCGMDDYISKPVDMDTLLKTIKKWLDI